MNAHLTPASGSVPWETATVAAILVQDTSRERRHTENRAVSKPASLAKTHFRTLVPLLSNFDPGIVSSTTPFPSDPSLRHLSPTLPIPQTERCYALWGKDLRTPRPHHDGTTWRDWLATSAP